MMTNQLAYPAQMSPSKNKVIVALLLVFLVAPYTIVESRVRKHNLLRVSSQRKVMNPLFEDDNIVDDETSMYWNRFLVHGVSSMDVNTPASRPNPPPTPEPIRGTPFPSPSPTQVPTKSPVTPPPPTPAPVTVTTSQPSDSPTAAAPINQTPNPTACNPTTLSPVAVVGTTPIDLSNWVVDGAGSWIVADDQNSVLQTLNTQPGFFCSDFTAFGNDLAGQIAVLATADDDFIGFALGYIPGDLNTNQDADYILIDWKQGNQVGSGSLAQEGFAVSRVTGIVDNIIDGFWSHDTFDELARGTNFGDLVFGAVLPDCTGGRVGIGCELWRVDKLTILDWPCPLA